MIGPRASSLIATLSAAAVLATAPTGAIAAAGAASTRSKAVNQAVVSQLAAEIQRSKAHLDLPGAPRPYFIGFKVTEVQVNNVAASLGSLTAEKTRHFVVLEARVHAGSFKFDNTNFMIPQQQETDGVVDIPLPLEPSPATARRLAWLVIDSAYKEALEQYTAKSDALQSGGTGDAPSYTPVKKPYVHKQQVLVTPLETTAQLAARAKRISAVLRKRDGIRDSHVAFTSYLERRWILDSDGTNATDTRRVSGVIIVASTQAKDGQALSLYYSRYGLSAADIPSDAALVKVAKRLSAQLAKLRTAPLVDNYSGPVLFEGGAAADIVRETLAPELGGTPLPTGMSANAAQTMHAGALADRIGLRVVSPLLSIVDDPTSSRAEKRALIGAYHIDDEGVPAERVQVVRRGKLKTLLMSRTPSQKLSGSNGHARLVLPGGVFHGSATNLFVKGRHGISRRQLERKLAREAKAQGLKYGILIRQLDDAQITAAPELSRLELFQLLQSRNAEAPPPALLAYRVYPNGRKQLVRAVQLKPVGMRAWRDVMAVSRRPTVKNFLASTDNPELVQLEGGGPGFVPSSGVESAVVTPDLLFRDLDVERNTDGRYPHPAVPSPH